MTPLRGLFFSLVLVASLQQATSYPPATTTAPVATSTVTSVAVSLTNVVLVSSNTSRRALIVFNNAQASLYLKLGVTASLTSFTVLVPPGQTYEFLTPIYTGEVDGFWVSGGSGSALITELTP